MKNIKNFIFIGSNNLSKLLTEINQISTIKVTIYKESSKKTFIILPHLASGKKSSGREIKITITDKEELGEFLNGISIVSRRKMEKELEIVNAETNLNQKEVIILKSPPLCGKMFEFLTETQGLFSNESSNLCAAIQRNRFYASDGQIANSMHVLPISQFSRDVLVTGGSSLFPKLTGSDQEAAHLNSEQHNGIKDPTEDNDDHLHKKSKLDKRMSEFETCLSEIFYDTINKEVILVEHTKRTKNSKSSPAVVEVHEFRSNDQPRVKKSRVLVVSESRFKKLENSFVKFQAKKKIRNLEPLLTEFDNKNEIMEKLEDKFVDKFRQMQNTYKKKNLIVMNFDLPGRLTDEFLVDVNGSKFENSLMSSKTYIDALKTSFDIAKKRKNRGNLVVVNDQIFKTSTCPIINAQNKHFLGDDNKALVFLNNAIYKELEKETMFSILNRKYSTGENKARKTSKSNPVSATDKKSPKKNQESSKVQLSGYSEIPLDNLIAAVAEKKRIEYASRSKIVLEVYEHYEKILENTKILNPPDGNNWKNIDMKNNSLSKVFRGGTGHKVPKIDRSKGVAPREIFTKEVKTDENINRNKSECSKVFKGESASTRTILPYDNTKTAPKGFNTEEMRANENIDQNEYDFSTLFKGESTIAPTGIDLSHEKNEIAPTDISTKEVKANKNINRNEYDLPKVFKGEYVIRTSEIDLPYAKIDKVPRKVSTKETKDNKTVNQNRHDLLEVIKSKSATKFPAVDLTHEKNEITVRKVSTKEAKSNRNIDQNEHDLPQVIKTKSAIRPSKDVPYEKNQTLPRKVSTKEVKSSRNIDQIKHDLPQVIKTKSVCRPPAVNQSHEKKEMIPRKISTKEVEATKNTDHNKHDLSNPIRVESSTRPITTDLPHEQKEIALKEISNKKEKAREYIDRNEADPSKVVEKESASRSSAIDPLNAENNITSIQDSTIRKRDTNFDQNECDLPKICKTECDNKIAEVDSPNEENEMANEEMKNKEKGDEMNAAKVDCQSPTLKAEVQHVNLVQQVVSVKSKIPVKALSTPKSNASVEGAENDDIQQNWLQNDEKFIDSKLKIIQDEHTSKETVKEMTSTTAKNIHKVTINEKSSTIKSRLPRLSKPIKHTISKDNNETFLKIPKAEDQQMKNQEDSLVSKKKTGSSKEIEEFIDLKKVINPNRFFADVHRLIFSEQDEGEMELFSRKIAPNKFQLQFLQNVLKRPAESTYQPAKSNDEDCEAVVKRMVTQIENEESAFHLKIAKREPGTFVIIDPPKNEETVVGQNDSLTSKSNYSMDSQKKTSRKTSLPEGKELPLQTQIISHLEKFPVLEKSLDEIQEKKIIDEQYSHPPKNSVVSNQNEIGENNNIDIEEKGRSNILKNVTDVEQGVKQIEANVKTKETKQSQEKQENASSKSVPQANKNHYGGDDTSRGGVDLSDKIKNNKDPQQTTVKSENVSKNETLHLEEKFEAKKKPLTTIKKKIFTNAKGIIDKTGLGENGDIESKITIENRKINNEIFKGEKMHRMKVQGKIVNAKEKVKTDGKKKQQKEENIQLAKNKTRLESGKLPNEVGPKSDVINAANNIEENAESSVQEKQKPITEKIEKFGRNEETISQHQSEMKKSCETEEKLKLLKIVSENVIKKKGTTDEPNEFLQKSKPMDQQSVETEHEKRNVTLKETSECSDGIPSKIVEIRDEERKIIIENIEAKNTQSELEEGSSFHKSDTLADNSSSNIGNLKEEPGTQNKIMKREQDSGKGKNNEVSSSEVSELKKTDAATEIPTDVKQTQFPIDKSDQNVECHLTVVENERRDVTEKSSDFKAKLEELPKTSNGTDETSGNIDEKKLESTDKVKEIVHKPKDVKASMKKTTKGKESSVLKCQCHNDNIPKDVSKKSASENVIIIKAAKKDSEETVESVLGITKPFLEQIQSKMLNFVTKKTKSKAKIRNFSFRSHAVKKCKEITALLKHSQEKLFEDNTAGLANICQHAKMINRFSRTKLPPKRLNGATPKTGNTFGTNATDKPKQPQDKKVKKKATPTEELVKSTIETKVASKMKSLAKSPNDGKKSVTVKIIKPPQTPVNQSDVKQSTKLDENKDLFNSSDSITDLGKDSIGSIFAEVVASAMIKCGKVEQSSVQRSDSQDEFANIMNMAQDIKQKLGQVEVTEIEEDVEIENNTMKEIKKPDEFIIEGNDLRKLGLNVKFDENRARCSGDKYKCTISLVLDKKAKEEDVMLLKSETPVVVRPDDDKTSAESSVPLTIEVTEKSEEKQIEIPIKQILTMDDKTKTVNFKVSPQVEVNVINDCNADKTKIDENNGREELETVILDKSDKLDVEVKNRIFPVVEKTNREEQKCILRVDDEIKRHAFEFIHTQSTDAAPKLHFEKISKIDTQKDKNPRENLDNEVTIIKNNQEVVVTIPIEKKIPRDINEIGGFLEELDIGNDKKNEKGRDGSTFPVPDHLMRFSKVQSDNVPSTSKLKSFVGKSDEVNVEIGKIVEFHGLNRQNRNSAMKYLSFSDEYSKNTLDVFPEVFFTPFASKTNVSKEMDVVSEDTEENFGFLQNLSNVGQVKTGISKVIHIATNDPTKNNTRNLTYANDIRTSCRVNDFPNSKICREIDKPASKNIQNFEYLKKRIEQDRLKTHAKVSNSKDEMKAKKKSEETLPNKKKCDEISEDLKQAFAGLEKMGNSIKEKPPQRENVSERSSVRTPIGDYLRSQRRDFATKNPFIYSNDLTQSLSKKLYPKKSNVEARAQFVQMKVEVPEDAKKESLNKSPEADMKTSQNVSRKNSFYHEMVRRSEANKKTVEKKKEIDIVPENSTFCVFNAMKESFDEVCATKKVYLGSRPSMKQYAQMIMADEVKSCNELSQMKNKSFSNTNSNVENPKIDVSENEDPKLPASEMYLYNLETTKHNRPQSSGSIGISNGNKSNEIQSTRGAILNTQKYFKTEEPEERDFKTFDVTAILEKKQKRSPDSLLGSVHYEPLVIEDLHVTIGENSESHKEDDFSFKPKISQIPIRTSDVMPKHNVLEKFAAIERAPGSPVYKIRGDLTFDSSTKRIQKNANATHEKQKPRPQVSNAKSKGVAVQEHATKKPSTAKPKSKKMVVKLTPSKQLYSPPQKNDHDDLKRTLLKNPSKLLEIAGEIMDKNQYLNFLLDLKSRKEIRNFWWKKIYDGILSSLKLTETFTTKTKRSEKSNIKVKSSFPSDATKMKSKKAMKVIKKESFNLESLFIAPKKERKKEKIIVVKEKPAMPNLTKRLTTKSLRATPNSEVNPNIISIEKDTDNMRSKSANLKSPKGNQMLKSDTNQDSTNRRNLSSQHRESVSSKNNSLPYTLKKYLETPDLTTKKSNVRNVENKRAVENFQNVFVLGEELKMPKLKYTVACVGMPNEFEKFNGKQIVEEELIVNKSQRNLKDIASSQLLSKSTHLKDVETTSMLEEECFKEIQLQAEEGMKSFSDYKNEDTSKGCDGLNHGSITEIDISENVDEKPPTSSLQLAEMNNVVVKTRSDKDSVFEIPEHLITDESIGDGIDNSVELSAQLSSEKSFLKPDNDINQNSDLNMNASENSHIHLDEGEMNVFAKDAPRSIASSIKDSSDLDNYFDVLSFPISSTRSEIEECRVKMMDTGEFDDSSDVFSNRSAPASSACSAAREYMNAARRAASITSNTGEILQRDALFDDMRKSNQKLMIGAKPTGNMNFQTRRKFENPLSKFVSKKKTTHSGHVSNVQHSQESIPDTHVENTAKVRVIRTKSLSEVLKDDPYFLTRLREQKKPPPYVTPRRVEEAPRKFEYRYHDFRRKYDVGGKPSAKSQPRKKDFFEKFRDLIQTKRPFGEDNQRSQGEEAEQTRPKLATKFNEKIKCVEDDKAADSEKSDKADGAATDRNTNSTRNFCNSLLLKSKFGSWRFVHTKMEHIDEDELMTWVQEHPHTPMSRSRTDNSKGDENDKHNVIHVPWISSSANAEEDN